jgi:RND family efflux transporter MFP subunit
MTFRVPRKRRPWWAAIVALAVVAGAGYLLLDRKEAAPAPPPAVQIGRADVTSSVAASGKVQPVATRELAFSRAGTLTSVTVKAGDSVAAGQVLATIDQADAQQAVDEAEDALAEAKQNLSDAKAAAASPAPTRGPAAPAAPAAKGDAIYSAQTAVNKAQLALDKARRVLTGTTISAPVAGKVLKVGGRAGDSVGMATFITLGVVEKMMVEAAFAEADAVSLAVGQKAEVTLSSHSGQSYPVTITQVAALGTVSNRLVRYTVLLAFDEPPADLLIGQSATAHVVLQRAPNVLRLPQSAVKMTGTDRGEVRLADGTLRPVGVGLRGDGFAEITTGLAEGDTVRLNAR